MDSAQGFLAIVGFDDNMPKVFQYVPQQLTTVGRVLDDQDLFQTQRFLVCAGETFSLKCTLLANGVGRNYNAQQFVFAGPENPCHSLIISLPFFQLHNEN